ncbi:serine/threonine-protein kinase [Sorangium atrum]|uniref:Protein kinase n=1 Tax=Sorangium atrum TaxID=2995308 RepID=A0ABT5C970_9BACT|nr:serine/threonine-protein kinase [Sorangium aterium]MDC0682148.1 protein kinase [Sorangium aterium]
MARGGMGEVFRAVALGPDGEEVPVAIKRIVPMHAGSDDLRQLFIAEASMMTRLKHPNIDEVLDFGVDEAGDFYLVLELVSGTDLGRLCKGLWARGESVPVPIALFVAAQVLEGLGYAHERSAAEGRLMVHRDVSPGNVLISLSGVVKIADFGVAIATRGEVGDAARRDLVGKPSYMPPEQFDGERVDARADVFALGVVLFQMLTGTRPFPGSSAASRMAAAREGQMLRASERRPEVSPALEAILARALAPRRDDRFPDARAMLEAIEALREAGHEIGTPEDLGALVSAALKESPESRPPGPHTPELPEDEDDLEGGELTRADADSPFTLRATRRPGAPSQVLGGEAEALDGIDAALPAPSSAPVSGGFHVVAPASGDDGSLDPLLASSLRGAVSLAPRPRDEARPPSSAPGAVLPPAGATRQRLLAGAIACAALAGIAIASVRVGRGGPSAASPAAVHRVVRAVQPQIAAAVQAALLPLRRAPSPASRAEGAAPAAGSTADAAPTAVSGPAAAPATDTP